LPTNRQKQAGNQDENVLQPRTSGAPFTIASNLNNY
jgi:hypothetical protein